MMELKGKAALVAGGGGGNGRAVALALAGAGAKAAVADIAKDNAAKPRRYAKRKKPGTKLSAFTGSP